MNKEFQERYDKVLAELIRQHNIAQENLTATQLASVIKQAIAAGDFQRNIDVLHRQSIVYIPGREVEKLRFERDELAKRVAELEKQIEKAAKALGYFDELKLAEQRAEIAEARAEAAQNDPPGDPRFW